MLYDHCIIHHCIVDICFRGLTFYVFQLYLPFFLTPHLLLKASSMPSQEHFLAFHQGWSNDLHGCVWHQAEVHRWALLGYKVWNWYNILILAKLLKGVCEIMHNFEILFLFCQLLGIGSSKFLCLSPIIPLNYGGYTHKF